MTPVEVVTACREALGSSRELAKWVGRNERTVRRWLAGEKVPDKTLAAMVAMLNDTGDGRPVSVDLSIEDRVLGTLLGALKKATRVEDLIALSEEIRAWVQPGDPWS